MEVTKLVVNIVICLAIIVIGGGLLGTTLWLTLRLKSIVIVLEKLHTLFERVIDNEAAVATSAEDMTKSVTEFKASIETGLRALVVAGVKGALATEGFTKTVAQFEKSLIDISAGGKRPSNYDVAPDIKGLSKEQQEQLEAAEIMRTYETKPADIMGT